MQSFISYSENETRDFAKKLAAKIKQGVIALSGDLGAGKTTFVQGFAQGLKIKDKIISPTFVLIRQHQIPNSNKILYHIDLYRLENLTNVKHLGLEEIWSNPESIVIIEWAEKIKSLLPKNTIEISLEIMNQNSRQISLNLL